MFWIFRRVQLLLLFVDTIFRGTGDSVLDSILRGIQALVWDIILRVRHSSHCLPTDLDECFGRLFGILSWVFGIVPTVFRRI